MRVTTFGRARATVATVAAVIMTVGLVWSSGPAPSSTDGSSAAVPTELELAADLGQFRAGNIISDNLFYDGSAMSAGDVQAFLERKGSGCGGTTCIKIFRQDTESKAADSRCAAYAGAAQETAAAIIAKVGQACGISQRALVVMLQKEQGLITASAPTASRYRIAMGYGCPDTAACDTQYYGFFNQVYNAARQLKNYKANPNNFGHRPFTTMQVRLHPNTACGSSAVYLANYATAGLYNYTPYQPNGAALAAGYGTGDSCSAYGNRNFWLYYTDWFGSTQSPGGNAIVARSQAPGATALGSPITNVICGLVAGGCYEHFQHGSIYWSPSTGAQVVWGAIRARWAGKGWENGALGYPTRDETCGLEDGGCFQTFQGGSVYWSPQSEAHAVFGAIFSKWGSTDWERGPLGYPVAEETCGLLRGGCTQEYQGAVIHWSSVGGARITTGQQRDRWQASGWEGGPLGYPTTDTTCGLREAGCFQHFEGGSIYSSSVGGVRLVPANVRTAWAAQSWETGTLGYPVSETTCGLADSGCYTMFEGGSVYSSAASGTHSVVDPVATKWASLSWERGPLRYPTSDTVCGLSDGGCKATFQGGAVYATTATGARTVWGSIGDAWLRARAEQGALGYPVTDEACGLTRNGCSQDFQNGTITWSPAAGTHSVTNAVMTLWDAFDRQDGAFGYPVMDQACGLIRGGCYQNFEGVAVYTTPATGTHPVLGAIRATWAGQAWERGSLGYPTSAETCGLAGGGCSQRFEGGDIYWSPATGARIVLGAIASTWKTAGAESSPLGYPITGEQCGLVRGGCFQQFERGSSYWSPATGAHAVSGAILSRWGDGGWERGSLGYPVAGAETTTSEITQRFEGGTLVQDRSTGTVTRR